MSSDFGKCIFLYTNVKKTYSIQKDSPSPNIVMGLKMLPDQLKCKRERRKIIGLPFVDCITVFLLLKHVCVL